MQANVIAAKTSKVDKVIELGGNPEFSVSDGRGNVYVNIKDKSEIVQIDSKTLNIKARWPLAPCEAPSGLALDRDNHRLFSVCGNGKMVVIDADTGKVVAALPIGALPDGTAYDPVTKLAFSSNRDGTLTVVRQIAKDEYAVSQKVKTELGARTMALDPKTHKVYLSSAELGPKPAGSKYPSVVPGTFKVLVLQRSNSDLQPDQWKARKSKWKSSRPTKSDSSPRLALWAVAYTRIALMKQWLRSHISSRQTPEPLTRAHIRWALDSRRSRAR